MLSPFYESDSLEEPSAGALIHRFSGGHLGRVHRSSSVVQTDTFPIQSDKQHLLSLNAKSLDVTLRLESAFRIQNS